MFVSLLKKAVPVPKLTSFDKFLFVGPHPDDVELACGGTVATLTKLGKQVTILIATNGCVGSLDPNLTSEELVQIRKQEATNSAKVLGVSDVRFLPYDDGDGYDHDAMKRDIVATILDVQPQVVLCPDHTLTTEWHPDHLNVGKLTTEAVFVASWDKLTARMGLSGSHREVVLAYYYTGKPNGYVAVTKTHKLRAQALACHATQFTQEQLDRNNKYLKLRDIRLGLRCGKRRAEGYRISTPTLRHCFPEASEY